MYAGNSASHIVNVDVLPRPLPTFAFNATDFQVEQPKELKNLTTTNQTETTEETV